MNREPRADRETASETPGGHTADADTEDRPAADEPAIRTRGVTKRYGTGDDAVVALDGLDLAVERGEVFGFLGPNGAGKSTTIDILLDYTRPTDGSATVLGMDAGADSVRLRERIGILPEGFDLYDRLSGRRHLEFAVDWKDADDDPDALLARVGLDERDAERPVGDYSKGMQQRLALGMALVGDPDLLILDEPSSGLDPHGIRQMRELVREEARRGTTVFFSSHVLGQVEAVCDRVGILYDGELVAVDTVDGLRRTVGAGSELRLRVAGGRGGTDAEGENVGAEASDRGIGDGDEADNRDTADGVDATGVGGDDGVDATDVGGVDVTTLEGVEAATLSDGILRVTVSDSGAKARVVARLTNAGVEVVDVDSEEASLEDVFTAYTSADEPGARRGADGDSPVEEVISP